jgi:WD40 repeat protein
MNPIEGHTSWINSVKFSTDGKQIVSGSHDYTICVWDAETGQLIAGPLTGHTHRVHSVAFSPDGTRVVSGSEDRTIRMWDIEIFQNLSPHAKSHTDKTLAIGGIVFRPGCRGWLGSHGSESLSSNLVLWVPWAYQSGIGGIETVVVFGRTIIKLDLSRFCWGKSWTECYSPLEDTSHDLVDFSLTQIHSSSATAARHEDTRIFPDQSVPTLDSIPDPGNGSGLSHAIPTGPPKITAAADDVNSDKPPSDHHGVVPESDQSSSYVGHLQNAIVIAVPLLTFYYFYSIRHRT